MNCILYELYIIFELIANTLNETLTQVFCLSAIGFYLFLYLQKLVIVYFQTDKKDSLIYFYSLFLLYCLGC